MPLDEDCALHVVIDHDKRETRVLRETHLSGGTLTFNGQTYPITHAVVEVPLSVTPWPDEPRPPRPSGPGRG